MKIEIHEKESNVTKFKDLEYGTIFRFGGSIMMKIYDSERGVDCGLGVDPDDTFYMETCYETYETAPIYEIYEDSKLTIQ